MKVFNLIVSRPYYIMLTCVYVFIHSDIKYSFAKSGCRFPFPIIEDYLMYIEIQCFFLICLIFIVQYPEKCFL